MPTLLSIFQALWEASSPPEGPSSFLNMNFLFFLLGRGVLEGISAFLEPDPAAQNLFSSPF